MNKRSRPRFGRAGRGPRALVARRLATAPFELFLVLAELGGHWVLAGWRALRPLRAIAPPGLARAGRRLARALTPAHALIAVAAGAAVALAGSQWLDYHQVSVGAGAYGPVEAMAPAPDVERAVAGEAHAWAILPIAFAALAAVGAAVLGRRWAAPALVALGLLTIAITLAIDLPRGLDEGDAAVLYQGAEANLMEGFWAQLAAAGVLCATGALLASTRAPAPRPGRRPRGARAAGRRARSRGGRIAESPLEGAGR